MNPQEIRDELTRLRSELGVGREKVAAALGVSAKSVERWEKTGRLRPTDLRRVRLYYARELRGAPGLDTDVPRDTSVSDWSPNPSLRSAIPARAYEVAMEYCRRLARAGLARDEIEALERILVDSRYAKANRRAGRELSEDDWVMLVDDSWDAIRETLSLQGVRV